MIPTAPRFGWLGARRRFALVGLIAGIVFFVNLGGPPLWDRDETRNARCAVEMLERGDWVTPYFNGEVRDAKPAFMYWWMMAGVQWFGVTPIAFRFFSAVAGVGTCLVTFAIARRLFGAKTAFWSGVALASSIFFAVLARTAKADALLIFFETAAMAVFLFALFRPRNESAASDGAPFQYPLHKRLSVCATLFISLVLGMATLAKGPVGAIPTVVAFIVMLMLVGERRPRPDRPTWDRAATIACWLAVIIAVGYLSWQLGLLLAGVWTVRLLGIAQRRKTAAASKTPRRRPVRATPVARLSENLAWLDDLTFSRGLLALRSLRPLLATGGVLAVAGPWYLWVSIREPGWAEGFFLTNNLGRAATSFEGHGGSDLFYYPLALIAGALPWSLFLAPAIVDWYRSVAPSERNAASSSAPRAKGRNRRSRAPRRPGDAPAGLTVQQAALAVVAVWIVSHVFLFSLAQTKLPNYVAGAFPAVAILLGFYAQRLHVGAAKAAAWWPYVGFGVLVGIGGVTAIALPVAAHWALPGEQWLGLLAAIPLLGGAALFVAYRYRRQNRGAGETLGVMAIHAVLACLALVAFAPELIGRRQSIHALLSVTRDEPGPLAAYGRIEASWVLANGSNVPFWSANQATQAASHLAANEPGPKYLIACETDLPRLRPHLPPDARVVARLPYFLREDYLVLIRGGAVQRLSVAEHRRQRR